MIIKRKTQIILALLVSSVFLFEACATLTRGTSQRIPVTSNPWGAKITVDGKELGHAPMILKLKKKKIHIIRVEKPGYNPLEIRIARKISTVPIIGDLLLGGSMAFFDVMFFLVAGYFDEEISPTLAWVGMIGGGILVLTAPFIVDFISGAGFVLSPAQLDVTLKKQEGKPEPDLIVLDSEQFQNIKWIRIRCDRSDGEENFEKN